MKRFLVAALVVTFLFAALACENKEPVGPPPQSPAATAPKGTGAVETTQALPSPMLTEAPATAAPKPTSAPLPTQPPAPTTVAVTTEFVSVTSPVSHGSTATVMVQTAPGAQCSITVIYKSGPSEAQGLGSKQADSSGRVSWTWKVGTRTTPGEWPIIVTCEGQTIQTTFRVT